VEALLGAEPNCGHLALAELESEGWLNAVITQNVDGLHQRAGSRAVLELHGHIREATCITCQQVQPTRDILDQFLASNSPPHCPECGGVMKPNVVLIGEQLLTGVMNATTEHVRRADLMLVAGSSLEAIPASLLPLRTYENGGGIVVVNLEPTYADGFSEVVIRADVAEALPRIARAVAEG
jgi:NAD-dependent deacetylase